MLFSSISFIYYFLPITLILYFCSLHKLKNILLLTASLFFYFCGEPKYTVLLIISSAYDYVFGLIINKHKGTWKAKASLTASVVINLSLLGFFKYADFFIETFNQAARTNIAPLNIPLPIGISFYTFQTMSYTIDVYRQETKVQKNLASFAAYVCLFPQLIAGPIVRYQTVAEQMDKREHSFKNFAGGAGRFVVGLAKKVLLANALGELNVLAISTEYPSVLFYWLSAVSFSLQIYFDFSGYSDMAIGLGQIFGFHFLENFNYPYISKSISEFWNRWHISLGTWFREYVYIPLGGNRVSKLKWVRNIFVVWFLTGFWHGANWNFIVWGLYFGIFLAAEKMFLLKLIKKLPAFFSHFYVVFFIIISFVIFNATDMKDAWVSIRGMFGTLGTSVINDESIYYLRSYSVVLLFSVIGATPLIKNFAIKIFSFKQIRKSLIIVEPAFYAFLLIIITGYLIDSSFNPFLYFRF